MPKAFILFHLNLAYSSITVPARGEVIRRCYRPLLALASESAIPIGIEMSSWTLKRIQELDPQWVARLKGLLTAGKCELIGSGYVQLIGPLVPYEVNVWNQSLGREDYQAVLDAKPRLALVNEMAYSTGLVDIYKQAGYQGIVMDRDNVRLALGIEDQGYESVPSLAQAMNGEALPVLWSDSILFQKLQRYAHADIGLNDYLGYFRKRASSAKRPLAVYCNDAEVFDYRPGRFREESLINSEGEWARMDKLLRILTTQEQVEWLTPSEALAESVRVSPGAAQVLTSITQPIPVKKQAKYNVSRWAVTGRNDLWINTMCHRLHRALSGSADSNHWKRLCELWSSDLRTHIVEERWEEASEDLIAFCRELGVSYEFSAMEKKVEGRAAVDVKSLRGHSRRYENFEVIYDPEGILMTIRGSAVELVLNLRRGLTIYSLAFRSHDFVPIIGTIPHGYFDSIEYGADYYSGGVIVELPVEHRRITDLEHVVPEIRYGAGALVVSAVIDTTNGPIEKRYTIRDHDLSVELRIGFRGWSRPHGTVRAGTVTLLPEAFGSTRSLECVNGEDRFEHFMLDRECDHTSPSSSLVSSTTGLGATTGVINIGDESRRLEIKWDPAECAVFPMIIHRNIKPRPFTRLMFSLAELDDTSRPEGMLPDFWLKFSPVFQAGQQKARGLENTSARRATAGDNTATRASYSTGKTRS